MFKKAKWIWLTHEAVANTRVNFFIDVVADSVVEKAVIKIGCETKYWMFVNGTLVVFDGGLFRESKPNCGYFDEVDLAPYLIEGRNEIVIHVWYFGNGGRNNVACASAGLIFECDALGLYSDAGSLCEVATGYYTTDNENPSYLYGGHNVAYNAQKQPFSLCPVKVNPMPAVVVCEYGGGAFGELLPRTVPQLFFGERVPFDFTSKGNTHTVKLSRAMQFSPYFKVIASGGEVIDVRSDRYAVNGGPGDCGRYFGHRVEYVCRPGEQEFEMLGWIFGEQVVFEIPQTVKIISLGVRESGYDCKTLGTFECDNPDVERLFEKCVNTLRVCMRENFMDCPDRERGQWIGDVSVQAPQVVYLLDENARLLLKKAVYDFLNLRKGNVLVGNVPGDNFMELPSQSLNAISEWGMLACYYRASGDKQVLRDALTPAISYLKLWQTDEDGVVVPRAGDWEWYDHLFNCDGVLLNQCWYYSALCFAEFMATEIGGFEHLPFITERKRAIKAVFDKRYWKGAYYASGSFADDRANAMAVLCGLCGKDKYPAIRYLLTSVFNSTTYMENYVLTALCEMGYKQDAFRRMMARYQPLIQNENSTLWEDFYHLGTKNHAWSGGPATILFKYFAGVNWDLSVSEVDDIYPLKWLKCSFRNTNGEAITIEKGKR